MQPLNISQSLQQLQRKIEEEQRLMVTKKAALEQNTHNKEKLMEEIRTHEQEIHAKEAEIIKLKQGIIAEKQEVNKADREKPKLQQEVTALAHDQDEQRRKMQSIEQQYRNNPGNSGHGGAGHVSRPL